MNVLRKWARLSRADRALLFDAMWSLFLAKCSLLFLPFASIARGLGIVQAETLCQPNVNQDGASRRIRWAIAAVSRRLPWKPACLVRALASHRMLSRRGLPSTLYLGVRRGQGALEAHAWLRCGAEFVTGDDAMTGFTPVCCYATLGNNRRRSVPEA